MVIRLSYDTTLPFVSHWVYTICSWKADAIQWLLSKLCHLTVSRKDIATDACFVPQKVYRGWGFLNYVIRVYLLIPWHLMRHVVINPRRLFVGPICYDVKWQRGFSRTENSSKAKEMWPIWVFTYKDRGNTNRSLNSNHSLHQYKSRAQTKVKPSISALTLRP